MTEWTPGEIAVLRDGMTRGLPPFFIARTLGRTRNETAEAMRVVRNSESAAKQAHADEKARDRMVRRVLKGGKKGNV